MIRLFGGREDHPLADPREVRQIMLDLEKQNALTAMDEITVWLESLARADGIAPQQHIDLLQQFDNAARPYAQRIARDYAAGAYRDRRKETQLWQIAHSFWAQLTGAYASQLQQIVAKSKGYENLGATLGPLLTRLLRAEGARLKWDQFHYGPLAPDFWSVVGGLYLLAVEHGLENKPLTLGGQPPDGSTTPQTEYLKMLVFQASSMDSLLPEEIELAERLIAHLLPDFSFGSQFCNDSVYWVDCARAQPPTRLAKSPEATPGLRFFSAGDALQRIADLRAEIGAQNSLPPALKLNGQHTVDAVLNVLDHLALYWAAVPPMREHARHAVKSRLNVIRKFAAVHRALLGGAHEAQIESWIIEDVSQGGIGAQMQIAGHAKLGIGELLAMQPAGGNNWLAGVVRRLSKDNPLQSSVGIETLSKAPVAMHADSGGIRTEIILLEAYAHTDMVRIVVPRLSWEEDIPLTFNAGERFVRLRPIARLDEGEDFVLGRYKVEIQEELI